MNHEFQAHVTSQAFVLALSRPMIDLLELVSRYRRGTDEWCSRLNAFHALRRRGLISLKDGMAKLTEEGHLVLELCRRAGLSAKIKEAANG